MTKDTPLGKDTSPELSKRFETSANSAMNNRKRTVDAALARDIRGSAHELMGKINDYFYRDKKHVNEIIFVPMMIMSRIIRTHDAIDLLLKNGHPSEATVLALTQFELRLDLAYTASDVKHAAGWLDHEDRKWSLMSVKDKIETLFSEDAERAKLYYIFQFLSGIKHANPVYSELGFPARVKSGTMFVSTGEIDDGFSEEFSNMIFAYSAYQLAWSAQVLNVCTAQYAVVDKALRVKVRDLCAKLHPSEEELSDFVKDVVSRRKSAFGLKVWKRKGER